MKSVYFDVDYFDTVNACMIQCMKIKQALNNQKVNVEIKTNKDKYNHIRNYEIIFKNESDYMVYQMIR